MAGLGLWVVLVLGPTPVARAHPLGLGALLVVERDDGAFDVSLRLSPDEAGVARPALVPGADCTLVGPVRAGHDGETLTRTLRMRCEGGGAALDVAGLAGSDVRVLATVRRRGAPDRRAVIDPDSAHIDLGRADAATDDASSVEMLGLGAQHVALGIDHLLFVLGLLLLARTPRAIVLAITGFTLGHSVTLALATLEIVRAPSVPVEISIALSLVLVALEARRPDDAPETLSRRRPWLVASGFGLVHGLGFAGALAALDLGEDRLVASLLGFNLGVELGQLAFVALLLGAARAFASRASATRTRGLAADAIGVTGVYLVLDRAGAAWLGL